jgi:hypothetical protein
MMSDFDGSSIERELNSGERLLWKGRPRGGIRFRSVDFYLIPFSLVWTGFVFFAGFAALHQPAQNGAAAVPALIPIIPFVLIGLYILIGRFFVDAMMRARTEYGVTSRRAIIVSGLFSRNVKSIDLKTTSEIAINERGDKSGTITFGAMPFGWWMQRNTWSFNPASGTPAFEMVEDVRSVYRTIEQVRNATSVS